MSFVLSPVKTQLSYFSEANQSLHFDLISVARIDDDLGIEILIDACLPDASICLMLLSVCPLSLCPGIDYKTTTILLDGRRVKLELW